MVIGSLLEAQVSFSTSETQPKTPNHDAVDSGDSMLETAIRELKEEVDIEVDVAGYTPRYLGGHNAPRSRDAIINDNVACIALRARSTSFTPDMEEIHTAKWVNVPLSSFGQHPHDVLIPRLQFPISELTAVAELHMHSDAHIIDSITVLHNQDRCMNRIAGSPLPNAIISHTSPQVPLAVFAVAARARTRQARLQLCTPLPASTPHAAQRAYSLQFSSASR
jgi:hypothetical protein